MGILACVSESQPGGNDIYNIYQERHNGSIVVPPHFFGSPSMHQAKDSKSDWEEMKESQRYLAKFTQRKVLNVEEIRFNDALSQTSGGIKKIGFVTVVCWREMGTWSSSAGDGD